MELTLDQLQKIRKTTIIALFSDDDLMDALVLKGGNALEIGYGLSKRASIDIDVSLVKEFRDMDLNTIEEVQNRLDKVLNRAFEEDGYRVFDVRVISKPKKFNAETQDFWGGYEANFKIIEIEKYIRYQESTTALSAKTLAVNEGKKNVKIDFGRFEYCGSTLNREIDGFEIKIYTPELIVFEKLRAICQQMPEYLESIEKEVSFGRPRARDFYDIHTVLNHESIPEIDFTDEDNIFHLQKCFEAKRVPLELLNKIKETKDFHQQGEAKLRDSILNKVEYQGFEFYFEYVITLLEQKKLIPVVKAGK